jgi:hypothetical protein
MLMVPWPFPWNPPPVVDLTGDDDDELARQRIKP